MAGAVAAIPTASARAQSGLHAQIWAKGAAGLPGWATVAWTTTKRRARTHGPSSAGSVSDIGVNPAKDYAVDRTCPRQGGNIVPQVQLTCESCHTV